MSDRNKKLKKQSAHRNKAEGAGYFSVTHSKKGNKQVLSEKKAHAETVRDERTRAERKARVGKPQSRYLGNRTRTDKGRAGYGNRPNRLEYLFEWGDPAAGSKLIPEFRGESAKAHLTLLVRVFLKDNFTFYNDEWRYMILRYLIKTFNMSPVEVLPNFRTRLLSIKNNLTFMQKAVARFGPAFLPNGFVVVQGVKEFIHQIPIKDLSLQRAQSRFIELQEENVREVHKQLVSALNIRGGMPPKKRQPDVKIEIKPPKEETVLTDKTKTGPPGPTLNETTKSSKKKKKKNKDKVESETSSTVPLDVDGILKPADEYKREFRTKDKLKGVTFHKVKDIKNPFYLDTLAPVECNGAPFCGYASIDLCMGVKPDVDRYLAYMAECDKRNPFDIGTEIYLENYCHRYNFNLLIVVNNDDEEFFENHAEAAITRSNHKYTVIYQTLNHDESNWIILNYIHGDQIGHYVPLIGPKTREVIPLPEPVYSDSIPYFYNDETRFIKECVLVDPSVQDRRALQVRREKIEIEDSYTRIRKDSFIVINPVAILGLLIMIMFNIIVYCLNEHQNDYHREIEYRSRLAFNIFSYVYHACFVTFFFMVVLDIRRPEPRSLLSSGIWVALWTAGRLFKNYLFENNFAHAADVITAYRMSVYSFKALFRIYDIGVGGGTVINRLDSIYQFASLHDEIELEAVYYKPVNYLLIFVLGNLFYISILWAMVCFSNAYSANYSTSSLLPIYRIRFKSLTFIVSNGLAQTIYAHLQTHDEENADWRLMERGSKWLGTNMVDNQALMNNTREYICHVVSTEKRSGIVPQMVGTKGLVALSTLSTSAYVSPENLATITRNQARGLVTGAGNFVKKIKFTRDAVKQRPVGVAPIGAVTTNLGILGPGLIPVTDQIGVLAAFAGRSMTYEEPENSNIDEFIQFSKEFLAPFIEGTDCVGLGDVEPVEFFRRHYAGKRSQDWIEGQIRQYEFWDQGLGDISFDTHSCFVKLENSAKNVAGSYRLRPRLIMTMSPVMLFKCCRILAVIDRWNQGPFGRFQVKDMDPKEMIERITEVSDKPHTVTDYSSFESSIMGKIRVIENFVITELLTKAGMTETLRDFEHYVRGPRELRSNGVTMQIDSRCSGDPHTSCGNGIINVCIAAYCASKKGVSLHTDFIIAEGDDGITPAGLADDQLISTIGFKFSDSVSGLYCGDTDFLRRRWINGKVYLNIGRSLSVFWVKLRSQLSRPKQLFILRCMGCSLHHMSPGHPVLFAIVNRIGIETARAKKFNNWFLHIDMYKWPDFDIDNYPQNVLCDESMRAEIALGAIGFPPISIQDQIKLEHEFMYDQEIYIGDKLSHYDEVMAYADSLVGNDCQNSIYSESILELFRIFDAPY